MKFPGSDTGNPVARFLRSITQSAGSNINGLPDNTNSALNSGNLNGNLNSNLNANTNPNGNANSNLNGNVNVNELGLS